MRFRGGDELGDLRFGQPARIGNLREVVAVLLQALDVLVRGDPHDDQLAILVGRPDRLDLDPWCCGRERAVVLQRVGVVGQLGGRADVIAEHILGRWHAVHLGQVIDERADEVGLGRPFLDGLGEVLVLRLRRIARLGDHLLRGHRNAGDEERCADDERDATRARGVIDRHCRNSLSLLERRGDSIRGRAGWRWGRRGRRERRRFDTKDRSARRRTKKTATPCCVLRWSHAGPGRRDGRREVGRITSTLRRSSECL